MKKERWENFAAGREEAGEPEENTENRGGQLRGQKAGELAWQLGTTAFNQTASCCQRSEGTGAGVRSVPGA